MSRKGNKGVVHCLGHWINFVVVELARHYGRASSATTSKQVWSSAIGRKDEQGRNKIRFVAMLICVLLFAPVSSGAQEYEDVSKETQEAINSLWDLMKNFIGKFRGPKFQPYQNVTRQDLIQAFYEYDQFRRWLETQNRFLSEKVSTLEGTVNSLDRQLKKMPSTAGTTGGKGGNVDEVIKEVEYLLPQLIINSPTMSKVTEQEIDWLKRKLDSLERRPSGGGGGASVTDMSRIEANLQRLASRLDDMETKGTGGVSIDYDKIMRGVEGKIPSLVKDEMKTGMRDVEYRLSKIEKQPVSAGGKEVSIDYDKIMRGVEGKIPSLVKDEMKKGMGDVEYRLSKIEKQPVSAGGKEVSIDYDKIMRSVEEKIPSLVKDEIKKEMKDIEYQLSKIEKQGKSSGGDIDKSWLEGTLYGLSTRVETLEKSRGTGGETYLGGSPELEVGLDMIQREVRNLRKSIVTRDEIDRMIAKTPRGDISRPEGEEYSQLSRRLKRSEVVSYLGLVAAFAAILLAQ
ncbi:MAG: hypothetical protein QME81_03440 [bacterium]|nr:hypothetical protein [bacterium]